MNNPVTPRNALAAWLYFAVVILVVAAVWLPGYPAWVTGVIAWSACLLLLPRLMSFLLGGLRAPLPERTDMQTNP